MYLKAMCQFLFAYEDPYGTMTACIYKSKYELHMKLLANVQITKFGWEPAKIRNGVGTWKLHVDILLKDKNLIYIGQRKWRVTKKIISEQRLSIGIYDQIERYWRKCSCW